MVVLQLVAMESQRVPHSRQHGLVWNIAAAIGDAQRGEAKSGGCNGRHPAAVANSRRIERLRAIEHLARIGLACSRKNMHARRWRSSRNAMSSCVSL